MNWASTHHFDVAIRDLGLGRSVRRRRGLHFLRNGSGSDDRNGSWVPGEESFGLLGLRAVWWVDGTVIVLGIVEVLVEVTSGILGPLVVL